MDIPQLILVGVISLLTLMLLFLGFQVFAFLRDLRQTIKRANKIVDEIGFNITSEVLRIAFSSQKGKSHSEKVAQKVKREVKLPESNGQTNGEGEYLKLPSPPRFFKGIPKRR